MYHYLTYINISLGCNLKTSTQNALDLFLAKIDFIIDLHYGNDRESIKIIIFDLNELFPT